MVIVLSVLMFCYVIINNKKEKEKKAYTHKPDFTQESTDPSIYHKHNIYP